MSQARPASRLIGAVALLVATGAMAQSQIVPAEPVQFERVHLRQTVDSCSFVPENVSVSQQRGVITILQPLRPCFAPGPPAVVDIQLGAFAPGEYQVEIYHAAQTPPAERLTFTVSGLVYPAVYPAPPFPLADYGGVWWNAAESGWGLSLHQGATHTLVGALYVYGPDQETQWYTLQNGQWESSTRWSGDVVRSRGPAWSATWNSALVRHEPVGTATLEFGMVPGRVDQAELTYTIDGVRVVKTIRRMRF